MPFRIALWGGGFSSYPFGLSKKGDFEVFNFSKKKSGFVFDDNKVVVNTPEVIGVYQFLKKTAFENLKFLGLERQNEMFDVLLVDFISNDVFFLISKLVNDKKSSFGNQESKREQPLSFYLAEVGQALNVLKNELMRFVLNNHELYQKLVLNEIYLPVSFAAKNNEVERDCIPQLNKFLNEIYEEIKNTIPNVFVINYAENELDFSYTDDVFFLHTEKSIYRQLGFLKELSMGVKNHVLFNERKPVIVNSKDSVAELIGIGQKDKDNICELVDFILSGDSLGFYNKLCDEKKLSLIYGGAEYCCDSSFLMYQTNYLCFRGSSEDIEFVLEQRHLNVSAVYFRKVGVVYKFDAAIFPTEAVEKKLEKLKAYTKNKNREWKGVFLSYSRPYHYFYDMLPAFYYNYLSMSPERKGKFTSVHISSFDFLDISVFNFLPKINALDFDSEEELNDYLFENGFLIKLGYPNSFLENEGYFGGFRNQCIEQFDDALLSSVCDPMNNEEDKVIEESDFVLWVGVCGEKRRWKEQEKGILLCIDELKKQFKKICVIVDGITAPVTGHVNVASATKENEIYKRLCDQHKNDNDVVFVSLISQSAVRKIRCSQFVDVFLTGFLTDSMYPARFGRAVGIGHGSYAAKEKYKEHIHPNTIVIKSDRKRDESIFKKASHNWARQSYSIRSGDVLLQFKKILKENF
ncbi:hypothetical protein [Vreelandella hamiltonii]|uniref:Uncharacterized protein n=1 Tax=Halomonas johnsoniae TaxID=502832 RepID=A0ABQ2WGE9_9GAMM|nr:hypothetical protein [Halomonas johnsoniae]GGW50429.1 hypothetical protein GCM10007158_09220 [Halomonas johnsoniae]